MLGETLLHYRLIAPLGTGGMGTVYRAEDTVLRRQVAIKLMAPGLASDPAQVLRFRREAEAAAALSHPGIVTVHSVHEDAGRAFIVMELVEGEPLEARLRPGGMAVDELLRIGAGVADALAAAHARGIVHRDLKPANIMLGCDGRPRILDFGIAKLAPERLAPDSGPLTAGDLVLGTGPYMAPEQIRGRPLDGRADLFALGVILYECATGVLPFDGGSIAETLSAVLRDAPVPLRQRRPELPHGLEALVAQCLEKSPHQRPQGAEELRDALDGLRELVRGGHTPAAGMATHAAPRPAALPRVRGPMVATALAAIAAIALGWWLWPHGPAAEPLVAGTAALPHPGTHSTEAYRLYLQGRHHWSQRGEADLRTAIARFEDAIAIDPTYALAHVGLADSYSLLHNSAPVSASVTFPRARAAAERALQLDPDLPQALVSLGYIQHYFDWDWEAAEASYRRALELDPAYANGWQFLAELLTARRRFDEASAAYLRAEALDPMAPMPMAVRIWGMEMARDYPRALEHGRRTVALFPDFVPAALYHARVQVQAGEGAAAADTFERALARSDKSGIVLCWTAWAAARAGRMERARQLTAQLQQEIENGGYVVPYYRAYPWIALGEHERALGLLEQAVAQRAEQVAWLAVDPALDPLRGEPRFAALLARIGPPGTDPL